MEPIWQWWKQGFDQWEKATAKLLDGVLQSPSLLEPAGKTLTAAMRAKKQVDDALDRWWSSWGLPTRRDQERMLHLLNQLESRLYDLEEKLEDTIDEVASAARGAGEANAAGAGEASAAGAGEANAAGAGEANAAGAG